MAPKKPRNRTSGTTTVSLKRVKVTVEMKRKIVELKEQGMCVKDIARTFARPSSTICTILKNREKFMEVDASSGLTRISTKRLRILDDVEWLLLEWIRERHRLGEPIDEQTICERARTIAADLVKALPPGDRSPYTPPFEEEEFKASRGWFERFKQRTGMQDAGTGAGAGTGEAGGLLVATRQSAALNQGPLPPLLPANTSSSSSSSNGGRGGDIKEHPGRPKTEQTTTEREPPPPAAHPVTVDSTDENSSSSASSASSSNPLEGNHQRTGGAADEAEQQMSSAVSEMLRAWQTVAACIERYHPNRAVAAYVTAMFNEYGVAPIRLAWERLQEEQRH